MVEITQSRAVPEQIPAEFVIPLKRVEDTSDFNHRSVYQAAQREFGERYIEALGARPSRVALGLLKKHLALQEGDLDARLRSVGYSRDELGVKVPLVKHEVRTGVAAVPAKAVVCVAATNDVDTEREHTGAQGSTADDDTEGLQFLRHAQRRMFPFYLQRSATPQRNAIELAGPASFADLDAKLVALRQAPGSPGGRGSNVARMGSPLGPHAPRSTLSRASCARRTTAFDVEVAELGRGSSVSETSRKSGMMVSRSINRKLNASRKSVVGKLCRIRFDDDSTDEAVPGEADAVTSAEPGSGANEPPSAARDAHPAPGTVAAAPVASLMTMPQPEDSRDFDQLPWWHSAASGAPVPRNSSLSKASVQAGRAQASADHGPSMGDALGLTRRALREPCGSPIQAQGSLLDTPPSPRVFGADPRMRRRPTLKRPGVDSIGWQTVRGSEAFESQAMGAELLSPQLVAILDRTPGSRSLEVHNGHDDSRGQSVDDGKQSRSDRNKSVTMSDVIRVVPPALTLQASSASPRELDVRRQELMPALTTTMSPHPVAGRNMSQDLTLDGVNVFLLEELCEEVSQVLSVGPEFLLTLQADFETTLRQWCAGLSAKSRKDRVSEPDLEAVCAELADDTTVALLYSLVMFMWDKHVRASKFFDRKRFCPPKYVKWALSPAADFDFGMQQARAAGQVCGPSDYNDEASIRARQHARTCRFHTEFAKKAAKLKATRTGLFFALPVLVLLLRVVTDNVFQALYPLWLRTTEGREALARMDEEIVSWTDPHGYNRRMTLLQSTPAAARVLSKHSSGAHKPLVAHFNDISPIVSAALGQPASPGARRVVFQKSRLKASQRSRQDPESKANVFAGLYQDALSNALTLDEREGLLHAHLAIQAP